MRFHCSATCWTLRATFSSASSNCRFSLSRSMCERTTNSGQSTKLPLRCGEASQVSRRVTTTADERYSLIVRTTLEVGRPSLTGPFTCNLVAKEADARSWPNGCSLQDTKGDEPNCNPGAS